uniref:J domain-containing protein n=1 Tax=Aegilops tauschii subsp. strangulata TaxID=200361 RepID=A0A453E0P9_AEGTS
MPHLAASPASAAFAVAVAGGGRAGFRPPPRATTRARAAAASGAASAYTAMPAQPQPTFYDLLGISAEGSSFEDVRAAYRRMARKYHPDVSPPDAAKEHTRRFIQVQEAYETLSDPSRRTTYDRALARGVCRLAFSPAARRHDASAFYHQVPTHSACLLRLHISVTSFFFSVDDNGWKLSASRSAPRINS